MRPTDPEMGMFDRIRVRYLRSHPGGTGDEISIEGLFIEWDQSTDPPTLILKLDNGYNVGISGKRIASLEILRKKALILVGPKEGERSIKKGSIALLSMGGTISSRVDYFSGAVHPAQDASDVIKHLKDLGIEEEISPRILRSMLSEDVRPSDWTMLANAIVEAFFAGARGCVVAHGTDTLAMTSSALSFLLKDLPGPVVLVGSQRSSDRPSSDAFMNLKDAILAAGCADLKGVFVLMHGSISDDVSYIHKGTRVAKLHTSRRDAFRSVNSSPIGSVVDGKISLTADQGRPCRDGPNVCGGFDPRVLVLRATPQLDEALIDHASKHYRAIVIEGTGLGHVRNDLIPIIKRTIDNGVAVIMTSSCPFGMVDLNVYSTGRKLLSAGVIPAFDMFTEVAMIKTMYILHGLGGGPTNMDEFRRRFLSDIAGEIAHSTTISSFEASPLTEVIHPEGG